MPKKYKHTKRGKTMNYDQTTLQEAVETVQAGKYSIRKASELFRIPKSTIADRISGKLALTVTHGRPPALPMEVENKIVKSVKMASKLGIGLSRKQILVRTHVLCKRTNIHTNYKNFHAGKDWWEGVRKRHPELVVRKPEKLTTVRARMLNPEVIGKYFDELQRIIGVLNLTDKPDRIWNADETGFNFEHNPVKVVAEKGDRSVVSKTSNKSTNLTAMACVNAAGQHMPPMLIVKGKTQRSLHAFNTTEAPLGTVWTYQKNGWIVDEIGEKWFDSVFLPHCGPDRPQLLIIDGHASHESLAIIERAMEENVTLLTLPPHCTHYLQPLDRTVFGPLKRSYNEACSVFMQEHPLHLINKWTFPTLFKQAWINAVTPSNIKSGFGACGIMPLNKNAVPSSAYEPSKPTDVSDSPSDPAGLSLTPSGDVHLSDLYETDDDMYAAVVQDVQLSSSVYASTNEHDLSALETDPSEDTLPVLDLSDPSAILQLISSGDAIVHDLDTTVDPLGEISLNSSFINNTSSEGYVSNSASASSLATENVSTRTSSVDVSKCVDVLFAPKVISSRPASNGKRKLNTGHKLLTSVEVLEEKKQLETKKAEKRIKNELRQKVKKDKQEKHEKIRPRKESKVKVESDRNLWSDLHVLHAVSDQEVAK